jgi:hypothetical protein
MTFREASWRQWGERSKIGPTRYTEAWWSDRDHLVMLMRGSFTPNMARVVARGLVDRLEIYTGLVVDLTAEWSGAVLTDAQDWSLDSREMGRWIR